MNKDSTFGRWGGLLLLSGLMAAVSGCGDIFDVKNPGAILDEDLNNPELVETLVAGMSRDFSDVIDETGFTVARLTDELAGSGSYLSTGRLRRGLVDPEDTDFFWEQAHEGRWVAEEGLRRMREDMEDYDPANKSTTARAYLLMGLSNRVLGELFCEVAYDRGPAQPKSAAFERAVTAFNEAISHGEGAGDDDGATYATAAEGGLAQAYMGLGQWGMAVQHAAEVPTDFEYVAYYNPNSHTNTWYSETHSRYESSAYQTLAGTFPEPGDPRAPFTKCGDIVADTLALVNDDCDTAQGADGSTPHWRQEKFPERGSDVPVVKGTEMRLIEAEAALVDGDLATFTDKINEVRSYFGLPDIAEPASAGSLEYPNAGDDAWSILDRERHLTLWLEGRRLFDLHRWNHPFLDGGEVVHGGAADRRASCMPIAFSECQTNPNITCSS